MGRVLNNLKFPTIILVFLACIPFISSNSNTDKTLVDDDNDYKSQMYFFLMGLWILNIVWIVLTWLNYYNKQNDYLFNENFTLKTETV
jgi:hypothetical protein